MGPSVILNEKPKTKHCTLAAHMSAFFSRFVGACVSNLQLGQEVGGEGVPEGPRGTRRGCTPQLVTA